VRTSGRALRSITSRLSEGEGSVIDGLREISRSIHELEKIDPGTAAMFEGFKSAQIELTELESSVADYADDLETDPRNWTSSKAASTRSKR
jgi:DNA repair protein RecN (Recombination protein N)